MRPSFAVKLIARRRKSGTLAPARQGRPAGGGKLGRYRSFLIGRVKAKPDIAMPELALELATLHQVEVHPASIRGGAEPLEWDRERHAIAPLRPASGAS